MLIIPLTLIPLTSPCQKQKRQTRKGRGIIVRGIRCILIMSPPLHERNAFLDLLPLAAHVGPIRFSMTVPVENREHEMDEIQSSGLLVFRLQLK